MTVHKFLRYMDRQYSFLRLRRNEKGALRYGEMQDLVTEYAYYLDMCGKQKYDLSDGFILYPKDLQKSHDSVARRIELKAEAKTRRAFKAAYKKVIKNLDWQTCNLQVCLFMPRLIQHLLQVGYAKTAASVSQGRRFAA